MKAGQVIALCVICSAAGAQLGSSQHPQLGGKPIIMGGGTSAPVQVGGSSQLPSPYAAIRYQNVAQGTNSRISQARTDVVGNAQAWQTLYSQMAGDTREFVTPAPKLCDFNKFDLLVIHIGQKRTTGHSAYVSMIRREKPTEVTVDVVIQQPSANSYLAQQITNPYVVVVVEKQNVPYTFRSTFGYTTVQPGNKAPCGCSCGCPQCANGYRSGYNAGQNNPFGGEICPPMPQGGRSRGGGE